jgi:hypothetical protein
MHNFDRKLVNRDKSVLYSFNCLLHVEKFGVPCRYLKTEELQSDESIEYLSYVHFFISKRSSVDPSDKLKYVIVRI